MKYPTEILGEGEDDGTMPKNLEDLRTAVIGRKIVKVEDVPATLETPYGQLSTTVITLDDGTQVELVGSEDCCARTEVVAFFLHPEMVDHAILGVGTTGHYTVWHIFADYGDILELAVGWSCGNAFYYGYGFDIRVEEVAE